MLDIMIIYEYFGYFKGFKVVIVGDIINFWVVCFNMEILNKFGVEVYFFGLEYWYDYVFDKYGKFLLIDELVEEVDVMMFLWV